MREKPKDKQRLLHIIEAIDNIFEFTNDKTFNDYKTDRVLHFAIVKNLEIIGEACYLLTEQFKEQHPQIEWQDIIKMRHVLVHGYFEIKEEIIWATIESELKPLKEKVETIISKL